MKKILIANRGEIASRIIRTCKKMGHKTVAIYSEVDQNLPFVKEADEAYLIGKGPVNQSYLRIDRILEIARQTNTDMIHPGYGLLSENDEFAQQVLNSGLTFIGPSPATIHLMGDKIYARKTMKDSGVPILPGSEDELATVEAALTQAEEIGYPVMLKASGGGGGIGMSICHSPDDVKKAYSSIKTRAKTYFGSEKVFVEKYIANSRHIEIQIFGDQKGNYVHLFERDCSVQRRNQKVIEESHAPSLSSKTCAKMYAAALTAAKAVDYYNAGTIEFIVDEQENFYFLEMNTRLQVEHPVTELVTGLDLVEWQIRIALGEEIPLQQDRINHSGHSMEFRLYAENPKTFLPSPGTLSVLKWGIGDVRIDAGYQEGNVVSPFYDPLIAKCIVYGENRQECLQHAEKFFRTCQVEGIQTNLNLFIYLINDPEFQSGHYSTNILKTKTFQ